MMNMQEITRNINNYHNEVQANRTNKNINKFISPSNRKIVQKEIKNKKKGLIKASLLIYQMLWIPKAITKKWK